MRQNLPTARAQAVEILDAVLGQRRTLDDAIAEHPITGEGADAKFTLVLVLTVLRHLGQFDAILDRYIENKLPAKRQTVINVLRVGLAQVLVLETPAHAAVHATVDLLKHTKHEPLTGLVNAVLQRAVREKPQLGDATFNLPSWLKGRWRAQYGREAVDAIAALVTERPPLDLHCKVDIPGATRLDSRITRLPPEHAAVETLPGYEEGNFFVQDIAASYPVRLLGEVKERQVLDLCAAPGGKLLQLIEAGGFVTALDISNARMRRVKENLARMRMQANLVTDDIFAWEPSRLYDAVLLDAPCSATGTWRRHPEVVQLITEEAILARTELQRAMLQRAWGWVKPGGKLVYCVCSLEREEGEAQAEWFLAQTPDAKIAAADVAMELPAACITKEGYLRTLPNAIAGGMDGFFAVCFEKRA